MFIVEILLCMRKPKEGMASDTNDYKGNNY